MTTPLGPPPRPLPRDPLTFGAGAPSRVTPPDSGSGWALLLALGGLAVAALAVLALFAITLIVVVHGSNDDHGDPFLSGGAFFEDEYGYLVDDPDVQEATADSCATLHETSRGLPFLTGTGDTTIDDLVVALDSIIIDIDELGDVDDDTELWREDLASLRDQIDGLATGEADALDLMADDGLAFRMSAGSPYGCELPVRLLALDPNFDFYASTDDSFAA